MSDSKDVVMAGREAPPLSALPGPGGLVSSAGAAPSPSIFNRETPSFYWIDGGKSRSWVVSQAIGDAGPIWPTGLKRRYRMLRAPTLRRRLQTLYGDSRTRRIMAGVDTRTILDLAAWNRLGR